MYTKAIKPPAFIFIRPFESLRDHPSRASGTTLREPQGPNELQLLIFLCKLLHKVYKGFYSVEGHCVVDGGAHSANQAVALKVYKSCSGGFFYELVVDFLFLGLRSLVFCTS